MPVKLSVVNEENDEGSPSTYLFEEDEVTIGRSEDNHVTLSDPKRIVSSEHAMVRRERGTYRLIDRGSKNFTYVGSQRVTAQDPYELSDGDVFRIGDFRIEFQTLDTQVQSNGTGGETVFDHTFQNPMEEPAKRLVEAMGDLSEAYRDAAPQRRDDALDDALDAVDEELSAPDAVSAILSALGKNGHAVPTSSEETDASSIPSDEASTEQAESEPIAPSGSTGDGDAMEAVLDGLGDALAKVVRIPWRFRHEFIGQTVMQAPETQFLYSGEGDVLVEHLLDSSLSEEERAERLGYVEEAAEALVVHQVAMLNGYKASVMNGVDELLDRLDPEQHRQEVMKESVLFEYCPPLASPRTLERVRAEWQDLQRGEGSSAETRVFRPAFTKAYLARMTAPGSGDDDGSATAA